MSTKKRKLEHIQIALKGKVGFRRKTAGFERVELPYKCLPEVGMKEIDMETTFLGKRFAAPLMVEAMTGGCAEAEKINKDIAKACQTLGLGMGLGSQRAMLEDKKLARTYKVRDVAPDIFLAGNIGVVQLKNYSVKELEEMLEAVGADALAVHCNAAQEAVQGDGTTDFSGCLNFLDKVSRHLSKPVIVKEVGNGISKEIARELAKTKVAVIDVGGAGGTSWTGIEYLRNGVKDEESQFLWDYGIPTVQSIQEVKSSFPGAIIASGGVRSGLDIVKALALGSSLAGVALPVLKAQAKGGSAGVQKYLERKIQEIRTAMFLSGFKSVQDIKVSKPF